MFLHSYFFLTRSSVIGSGLIVNLKILEVYNAIKNKDGRTGPVSRNLISGIQAGPLHIQVIGKRGEGGTVICEQIKAIEPRARGCNRVDSLTYEDILNVSDAVQGIFEYD